MCERREVRQDAGGDTVGRGDGHGGDTGKAVVATRPLVKLEVRRWCTLDDRSVNICFVAARCAVT